MNGLPLARLVLGGPHAEAEVRSIEGRFDALRGAHSYSVVRDDALIGGFVMYIDGLIYDVSVRGQLDSVAADLAAHRKSPDADSPVSGKGGAA